MALQEINRSRQRRTTSDAAVDGLLAGIGAAIIMALFLLAAGFLSGDSPAIVLGRFDPLEGGSPLTGLLTHLAVAAIYGLVFGLIFLALVRLRPSLMKFGWLAWSMACSFMVLPAALFLPGRIPGWPNFRRSVCCWLILFMAC